MLDLFLYAVTYEALLAALVPLGLVSDGELIQASHTHALAVIPTNNEGILVAVRCYNSVLAEALRGTNLQETTKPAGWVWAGDLVKED